MRPLALLFLLLPALLAPRVSAAPTESVHDMSWFVHIDLIDIPMGMDLTFFENLIAARLSESDVLLQGHQGPVDVGCCVSLDPVSVMTFGITGDGLDAVTSEAEIDLVYAFGPGAYLVQSIHFCADLFSTGIRGCAQTPGDRLLVGFEAEATSFLPTIMAHERGHNGGLNHVAVNPCELMSASNGGGCLSVSACNSFISDADSSGGSCECLDDTLGSPPVALGTACTDPSGSGVCSGGVCGDSNDVAGARIIAAAGVGSATGQTTDDTLVQAGASNDWDPLGVIGVEVTGLAYDASGAVLYGIESISGGDDVLITIDPSTGVKTGTIGTLTGKEEVIALAFDPQPGGDRLFAVEVDDDFVGQTDCAGLSTPVTPPCFSELFEIDPTDASITVRGELNFMIITDGVQGLAWDDTHNTLYGATPAGIDSITLGSCDGFTCSSVAFDNEFRDPVALAWDPTSGRLFRGGHNGFSKKEVDTIDPTTGTVEAIRGVDPFTVGGMAVTPTPTPEPDLLHGLAAGVLLLTGLARRRGPPRP